MSRKRVFAAKYPGGMPDYQKQSGGGLVVNDECLGMGPASSPEKALVRWKAYRPGTNEPGAARAAAAVA
jgi:hypothetical protein